MGEIYIENRYTRIRIDEMMMIGSESDGMDQSI